MNSKLLVLNYKPSVSYHILMLPWSEVEKKISCCVIKSVLVPSQGCTLKFSLLFHHIIIPASSSGSYFQSGIYNIAAPLAWIIPRGSIWIKVTWEWWDSQFRQVKSPSICPRTCSSISHLKGKFWARHTTDDGDTIVCKWLWVIFKINNLSGRRVLFNWVC